LTAFFYTLDPDYPSSYVLMLPKRDYLNIALASAIDDAPPISFVLYLPLIPAPISLLSTP
jgi:hypothetical protein